MCLLFVPFQLFIPLAPFVEVEYLDDWETVTAMLVCFSLHKRIDDIISTSDR